MKKVVNLADYRNKIKEDNKLGNIKLTEEDRIQARNSIIYDDDRYILQMMLEEKE
ncbi:hypothetical protein OSC52_13535 [Clostridium pasteurianum]|uniref:hypothetical protein n=1 Tax=Clostridium pasteurianum TaxID=1501 RepID=UPI002260A9DB|nr:hypothetical protein [Clostridium pasteurianum]UZW12871.1 hypothetical protein OSC52_13535 [Clostridium pasteurianum]